MTLPPQLAGLLITVDDVIPPFGPYCAWGLRQWARLRNIDARPFFKAGVPAEQLLALNDHLADEVVARKIRRLSE